MSIQKNLEKIRLTLLPNVRLIAVSKMHPTSAILEAYHAKQRHFGENRILELEEKRAVLDPIASDIVWHLIGTLQSNKVKKAIELADYIHAVDSLKLLKRIDLIAYELNKKPKLFIEVNISGESSKHGLTPAELSDLLEVGKLLQHVEIVGLMTMAPIDATDSELHSYFKGLNTLRQEMEKRFHIKLPELSMGMSGDYIQAMAEGATFIRIGTAIFAH